MHLLGQSESVSNGCPEGHIETLRPSNCLVVATLGTWQGGTEHLSSTSKSPGAQSWILGLKPELFARGTEGPLSGARSCRAKHSLSGTRDSVCGTLSGIGSSGPSAILVTTASECKIGRCHGMCLGRKLIIALSLSCGLCPRRVQVASFRRTWSPGDSYQHLLPSSGGWRLRFSGFSWHVACLVSGLSYEKPNTTEW